jgi:hypothetical protein
MASNVGVRYRSLLLILGEFAVIEIPSPGKGLEFWEALGFSEVGKQER